ncbi:MAG: hypothetical protein KBT08_05650 [Bacteroidales bacterium]|nr:hypothetical protein [Candidatus Cryptobacteroides onthequi]
MVKCRKYIGIFLVLVYAFFFASTNLFYHSHQLADSKLVHSHPFSIPGHSHTATQILLIELTDTADYQASAELSAPDAAPGMFCPEISDSCTEAVLSGVLFFYSLRAPPASC